jgi:hypothetical protein
LGSSDSAQSPSPAYSGRPELGSGSPREEWWFNPDNYQTDLAEVRESSGGPSRENTHRMMWVSQPTGSASIAGGDARAHRRWLGALLCAFQPRQRIHPLLEQIRQDEPSFSRVVLRAWSVPNFWDSSPLVVLGWFWFAV